VLNGVDDVCHLSTYFDLPGDQLHLRAATHISDSVVPCLGELVQGPCLTAHPAHVKHTAVVKSGKFVVGRTSTQRCLWH